ncbi:MAG: (2Fe-2S)-binding protein [Planctomycetaceae bacterium]|nr:(2Fe-2S)-binding protein [Planctomycetaceae bacterium]MCP4815950.1 (2Fe-2S)-binding protein [Planctomycetaceae bacterium]
MTESKRKSGVSRRSFLKGSGAVAAAGAWHNQQAMAAEVPTATLVQGSTDMTLKVNGKNHKVAVEPRTTLLEVLRYQLDLTGAKPVSSDGSSGASTVMIDGKPKTASTTLALACKGKAIETVESLGGDNPDAVPLAFTEYDASQCGFCTPGFVVAVRAFVNKNPKATEAEIRQGLNGNICRCGTYSQIIEAAVSVVKGGK